jgi:hypothetical protein
MITFVVTCNVLLGLVCLLVAWQFIKLQRRLATASDSIDAIERCIHRTFSPAPRFILKGKTGTHHLREQYQQLSLQLSQVQQLLGLLGVGRSLWLRQARVFRYSWLSRK